MVLYIRSGERWETVVKKIFSFEVIADMRSKTPKYTVYLVGQWDDHIMDWRGCNFRRVKAPAQPIFTKISDAVNWAKKWLEDHKENRYVEGEGQHVSDFPNEYIEITLMYEHDRYTHPWSSDTEELSQEQWDELRKMAKEIRKKVYGWK